MARRERAAGRRVLRRVLKNHPRLFDVVSADALYGDKEFLQMILKARKRFVVTLKDDRRDAYDEADRLRKLVEPATWGDRDRKCRVWDIPDIRPWWKAPGVRLPVVWSDEKARQSVPGRRRPPPRRLRVALPPALCPRPRKRPLQPFRKCPSFTRRRLCARLASPHGPCGLSAILSCRISPRRGCRYSE